MQEDSRLWLFTWIHQVIQLGPLGLLSGPRTGVTWCHWYFCTSYSVIVHQMREDLRLWLFTWIKQVIQLGPLGLLSWAPYRSNLLSLVVVYILYCNSSSNARRFTFVTLYLNKSGNSVGPLGLLSGPRTGVTCCHWYFCTSYSVIVQMQEDSRLWLFTWIHQVIQLGPLGLLSEAPYRSNLLSLVFVYILQCNSLHHSVVQMQKKILACDSSPE